MIPAQTRIPQALGHDCPLLAIQPGVVPMTTMQPDSIIMAGVTGAVAPSGQLNPGNLSISGQRESVDRAEPRFRRAVPRPHRAP